MREIVEQSLRRLDAGERVIWCVILSAQGSAPRGSGARMAVFSDGSILGTVGGGAVELQALAFARSMPDAARAQVQEYDLSSGDTEATGMICGGTVRIGFFPLDPKDLPLTESLHALQAALDRTVDRWLETRIRRDGSFQFRLLCDADLHGDAPRLPRVPTLTEEAGALRLTEPVCRNYMVYLFGGGHVGRALVPILLGVGFPVTIFDPRPELAQPSSFPGAKVLLGDFADISTQVRLTSRDYAVVMTPAHSMDLTVLRQLLRTDASYIGCIGSRRKTAYVNEALLHEGFSETDIARIHAPIGLPIKAKTPEEIAISIAAEMILHRAEESAKMEAG